MTKGAREWSDISKNCIKGCSNDCFYCYWKKDWKNKKRDTWPEMEFRENSKKDIKKEDGIIMFPTTHDLHYETRDWWMPFLKGLLEIGNDMLIVSKPRIKSIKLICETFPEYKNHFEFRFTIGTDRDTTRKFWEHGAPTIEERIMALELAFNYGYETSISMEPLLTYDPWKLINRVDRFVTDTIWIGLMNHVSEKDFKNDQMSWYNEIKSISSFENMKKIYDMYKDNPKIMWKDSVKEKYPNLVI